MKALMISTRTSIDGASMMTMTAPSKSTKSSLLIPCHSPLSLFSASSREISTYFETSPMVASYLYCVLFPYGRMTRPNFHSPVRILCRTFTGLHCMMRAIPVALIISGIPITSHLDLY